VDRRNLTDKELEEVKSGHLALSIHPHYPFVFIDLILKQGTPPLITLWNHRSELRSQLVAHWCALAKTDPCAWDECDSLLKHLVWRREEVPKPLRAYARWERPQRAGRRRTLAQDLLIDEISAFLEDDGFSRTEAELAVALALKDSSSGVGVSDSTVRKARARACEFLAEIECESRDAR